jgi:hypothetical protein
VKIFPDYLVPIFSHLMLIIALILIDGEVSNANQIIDLVRKNSSTTSVFTFGIGNNVSRQLVNGMAEAGNGYAEYANSNERLQPKIIRQVKTDFFTLLHFDTSPTLFWCDLIFYSLPTSHSLTRVTN